MLNIGVDIDGVLSDFLKSARLVLNQLFGKPDHKMIQTGWGFNTLGIDGEEEKAFWNHIDTIPNWWLTHEPMPGTSLLKPLCDKHRVYFITNRKDGAGMPVDKQSAEWLVRNFHLYLPSVLLSDSKGPVAKGLKLNAFIDDRPKNVLEVATQGPGLCDVVMYDATYNQDTIYANRVKTFDEFALRYLEEKKPHGSNWSR